MTWTVLRRIAVWALLAVLAVAVVGALSWRLGGGRWLIVETPSMGTQAPVGTLLWVGQTDFATVRAGDFISFHPPTKPDVTFSHLVRDVTASGLTTGGLISGNDPWVITEKDLVGTVVASWFGVGWLVKAAPLLIGGGMLIALLKQRFKPHLRLPVAIVGTGILFTVAIIIFQPLTRVDQLAFVPLDSGGARARYVTTGLLPMRLATWDDAQSVVMKPGEVGTVDVLNADDKGRFRIQVTPSVPWWFWAALIGACFAPALTTLGRKHEIPTSADADDTDDLPVDNTDATVG